MINKDALVYEYREVEEQMRGISPKLGLHAELKARLEDIKAILGHSVAPKRTSNQVRAGKKTRYYSGYHHK